MDNEKEMDDVSYTNNQIDQIFNITKSTHFRQDLNIPIGENEAGELYFERLSNVPHLLVAGISESGKSAYIRTIISSLIVNYSPDQVRIVVIDTKSTDYNMFEGLPHLFGSVITDLELMKDVIKWMSDEIFVRFKLFNEALANDIDSYNEYEVINREKVMPELIAVIDDISFFRFDATLYHTITNILKNGRKAGIHLVAAMSPFPSKKIIDEVISRFPCRAVFKVHTSSDSKVLLEKNGAEMLQFREEMIYRHFASCKKYRAAYIPREIVKEKVEEYTLSRKSNDLYEELQKLSKHNINGENIPKLQARFEEEDDLQITEAVDIILQTGYASVSILQRRMDLGYPRAAKLIDAIAEKGYISPFEGSKPRRILISADEWNQIKCGGKREPAKETVETKHSQELREREPLEKTEITNQQDLREREDMSPVSSSNSLFSRILSFVFGRRK